MDIYPLIFITHLKIYVVIKCMDSFSNFLFCVTKILETMHILAFNKSFLFGRSVSKTYCHCVAYM